jgi:hypothetical protein
VARRRSADRRLPERAGPLTETEDLLRDLAPRVLGAVVRRYGHFDIAEDAVQEALVAAATQWPRDGVPDSPLVGAWRASGEAAPGQQEHEQTDGTLT